MLTHWEIRTIYQYFSTKKMLRVLLFHLTFSGSCVHDKQIVPSWAGWISQTSELQDQTSSTEEYMSTNAI
jgi:hypothetical protein